MGSGRGYLVFYTRPGCHLCAVAAPRVRRATLLNGLALQEINIDDHPELAVDYALRIPVVAQPDGRVLAEGDIRTWRLWVRILKIRWSLIGGR